MTYGVDPRIHGDMQRPFMSEFIEQDNELISENALAHLHKLRESQYLAEERLRKQAAIDKAKWDSMLKMLTTKIFEIGEHVLLRHESKKGLEYDWMGPHKIIKRNIDFNTYQFQEADGKIYDSWVHFDRLHPVKYDGKYLNKPCYIPRVARVDSSNRLASSQ